jgi:energy-coupling factor transporter ATP-binding protein EcfA2
VQTIGSGIAAFDNNRGMNVTVVFSNLKVRNFRSCIDTELELSRYTALVGRNNCGKSNCLTALQWLVKKVTLGQEDFNDTQQPIEVIGDLVGIAEADLATLQASHRNRIEPHVRDGRLTIRRYQEAPKASVSLTVKDPNTGQWLANPTGIDQALQALFPDPIRIGAMENAEEDASKAKTSTTIGKLLSELLATIKARHEEDLNLHLGQIISRLSAVGEMRFEELEQIDTSINSKIADLFPGVSIRLDFPVPVFEDLVKSGTVKVYEGGDPGRPFGSYGHGAQRAIQMALVRHLADVKRGAGVEGGATLLLIDEPELYLHPFALEHVREALKALSVSGYQVVFSTHSGQMVTSADAKNAVLITKERGVGTKARPRLENVIAQVVPDAHHQMEQLFTLTNSSQVLFADKVILTEGKTELRLLPGIYRSACGRTLGQSSIALVAQSSMNDTKKSMEILSAMGLPSLAIVDLDFAFHCGERHGLLDANDVDIEACKALLVQLSDAGSIRVDPMTRLPVSKSAPVPSSKAFELMAALPHAQPHVAALVQKLRHHGIWLWPKGAIEAHLGIGAKKEPEWLKFQLRSEEEGLPNACTDYAAMVALTEWMNA